MSIDILLITSAAMPSTADTLGEASPTAVSRASPEGCCPTNHHALARFVERTCGKFPSAAERDRLNAVLGSTEPIERPCVRLLGRRGSIFRVGPLQYAEIAEIAAAELGSRVLLETCGNTTGLPDLVRFSAAGGGKPPLGIDGPGDALQFDRKRRKRHFAEHGICGRVIDACRMMDADDS